MRGQGLFRKGGSEGSPSHRCDMTNRNRIRGLETRGEAAWVVETLFLPSDGQRISLSKSGMDASKTRSLIPGDPTLWRGKSAEAVVPERCALGRAEHQVKNAR